MTIINESIKTHVLKRIEYLEQENETHENKMNYNKNIIVKLKQELFNYEQFVEKKL